MNTKHLFSLLAFAFSCQVLAQVNVAHLRCENLVNPIGLDVEVPRFSWQLQATGRNVLQTAYEIRVGTDEATLVNGKKVLWSSGKKTSGLSVFVPYEGGKLQSARKYFWQVRVWDNKGNASPWSAVAFWQTGILQAADWKAAWIGVGFEEDSILRRSPLFRKEFSTRKKIRSATAFITARGLYEAQINGQRVGEDYLTPGWTSYNKRLQYQAYDVTNLVKTGANAVGVMLGSGWYRGYIGFGGQKNFYGKELSLLFQLQITYTDGSVETVVSDDSWKCSTGSVLNSEIYHGETIDARLDKPGWASAKYDDSGWAKVKRMDAGTAQLVTTYNEPIRKHERFQPASIFTTPNGEQVIDFGQNLVGWVEVRVSGKAGDTIRLKHAEILDKEGNFYTENLRPAQQTNTYILKGGGEEFFEPHFTFQGFRFVKIEAFPGTIKPENFTAVALYSAMERTGEFSCSHPLINQLQHNIQWGQRGNFLDVPTDCPQRDERLGWTGDAQAFCRTANFNFRTNNFFVKWMIDLAHDQRADGSVPFVIPNVLGEMASGSTGWADAATIVPWDVYLSFGDRRILENQYASMKAWVDYMAAQSENGLWNTGFHFGDWLFYSENNDNIGRSAVTFKPLIQQCFWAYSTQILVNTARVLGKQEDVTRYTDLLEKIKEAFLKEYVTPNGALVSATQTAYVLALQFDMLPENLRGQAAQRLVSNIETYGHLTTGFLGTPYLCHVLSRFGYTDLAYELLLREKYPSWLYPVTMGATTIWERWDGIKPDTTFQEASMNSFNHYAYGAIGDWLYRVVAGIDTELEAPGYRHIRIRPTPGGELAFVNAELMANYGKVASRWKQEEGKTVFDIEIPANTRATIYLPVLPEEVISEGGQPLSQVNDLKAGEMIDGYLMIEAGSGIYHFEVLKKE